MSTPTQVPKTTPTIYAEDLCEEVEGDPVGTRLELDSCDSSTMFVTSGGIVLCMATTEELEYGKSDIMFLASTNGALHTLFAYSLYDRI